MGRRAEAGAEKGRDWSRCQGGKKESGGGKKRRTAGKKRKSEKKGKSMTETESDGKAEPRKVVGGKAGFS